MEISRWWSQAKPPDRDEEGYAPRAGAPEMSAAPPGRIMVAGWIRWFPLILRFTTG